MRGKGLSLLLAALVLLLAVVVMVVDAQPEKPVVVASTTVLASIVEDLAGDQVTVEYIALPSVCPAHYDVKPSDAEKLTKAALVLSHSIEPWIDKLVSASGSKARVFKGLCRSWSTPTDLKNCYIQVADVLKRDLNVPVDERLNRSLEAIDRVAQYLKNYSKENGFEGTPVVVMRWQGSYISYLGFKVVASYGPPETVSLKEYSSVVNNATQARALLVIDNLPSGAELGMKIAREVGAVEVALHNFPKAAPEISNVTSMWVYNAKLLANALKSVKVAVEARSQAANATSTIEMLTSAVEALRDQNLKLRKDVDALAMYLSISAVLNTILIVALAIALIKLKGVKG